MITNCKIEGIVTCLEQVHFSRDCTKKFTCPKPGCGKSHHFLIHPPNNWNTTDPAVKASSVEQGPVIVNKSSVGGTATAPIELNPSLVAQSVTVSVPTDFTLTTVNHEGKYGCRASLEIEALAGKTKFTFRPDVND